VSAEARELLAAFQASPGPIPQVEGETRGWLAILALEEAVSAGWDIKPSLIDLGRELLRTRPQLDEVQTVALAQVMAASELNNFMFPVNMAVNALRGPVPTEARPFLERALEKLSKTRDRNERAAAKTLAELLGTGPSTPLDPGETWSDLVLQFLASADPAWTELVLHAKASSSSKASKKWIATAVPLLERVGADFGPRVKAWFAAVGPEDVGPDNGDALRGLAQLCALAPGEATAEALSDLTRRGLKKSKTGRLVSSKASKAAVVALGEMGSPDAVTALRDLERTIKADWLRADLEAALQAALDKTGPVEERVPTLGFTEVGRLSRAVGEFTGLLEVGPQGPELRWRTPAGKLQAGVPTVLTKGHKDEVQLLQGLVKQLKSLVSSQKERLESLFLHREPLTVAAWQDLLDHPVVGALSRRLIWRVGDQVLAWQDGPVTRDYDPVTPDPAAPVRLWHPVGERAEEVRAWQTWIEEAVQLQPFPQVYREAYADPGAFSGRRLRQNVFQAVRQGKGWKHEWLGTWDPGPGARRELAEWDVAVEWDLEPCDEGTVAPAGTVEFIRTGEVRFARLNGRPLTAEQVPALPRSELLRDVAGFVKAAEG